MDNDFSFCDVSTITTFRQLRRFDNYFKLGLNRRLLKCNVIGQLNFLKQGSVVKDHKNPPKKNDINELETDVNK